MRQTKTTITEYLAEGPRNYRYVLEPGTRDREPGTRNQEPGTRNREPGTNLTLILEKIQSQETEYEYNVLFLSQCQTSAMYVTNRAGFIRLYGEIIHELQRVDY